MSDEALDAEVVDGVAILTLDRPEKRNALNGHLVEALHEALADAAMEDEVRVVLIRGAGRDFCSGADLAELEAIADMGIEDSLDDAQRMGDLFVGMRTLQKPVIAAVHGKALAGGAGLATACDLILAHDEAVFGYPEVHLGFVPAMVMAILRRKLGEGRAFELAAVGHRLDAVEAERIGLVNRVLTGDAAAGDPVVAFHAAALDFARDLATRPASALALTKRLLYGLDGTDFAEGIARGAEVNAIARSTEACREGVRRFLDKS
ncbi:MAG TPA: enoyl-CoA hydratase/isomerase family protein [Longimicrobiales bacterium]|nr:enoyl-CoA hydratase/isomerase family protein [Longimicrobiales bacterium]